MKVKFIHSSKHIRKSKLPLVIGYFGGVHIMHHQILDYYFEFNILTFNDYEGKKDRQLYPFEERIKALAKYNPVNIYVVDIQRDNISAQDFINKVIKKIQPTQILVGSDFTFGSDQQSWKAFRKDFDVEVFTYNPAVSTSYIASLLKKHSVEKANSFLMEPYSYSSKWIKGKSRGRQIGYRTMNLKYEPRLLVPEGVYITKTVIGKRTYNSLTFVGMSKTFNVTKPTVETHILGHRIGGRNLKPWWIKNNIKIIFIDYLRAAVKFSDKKQLIEQISKDVEAANKYFAENK